MKKVMIIGNLTRDPETRTTRSGATVCSAGTVYDGASQPQRTYWLVCGACSKPIDYGDRFCRYCGRKHRWPELKPSED